MANINEILDWSKLRAHEVLRRKVLKVLKAIKSSILFPPNIYLNPTHVELIGDKLLCGIVDLLWCYTMF